LHWIISAGLPRMTSSPAGKEESSLARERLDLVA